MITHSLVPSGFLALPVMGDEYVMGTDVSLGAVDVVKPSRDWRAYIPAFEDQFKNGVESMSCATYGTHAAIETLMREHFDMKVDYSDRYTSKLAGTTRNGNSPHKVAETIRKYGVVEEVLWPFSDDINTWDKFYAPIPDDLKKEGKEWSKDYRFGHEWVMTPDTRPEEQRERLLDSLYVSPVGVAVYGWAKDGDVYVKIGQANHWCTLMYMDKDYYYVLDTYAPYLKKLSRDYPFTYAKRYTVSDEPVKMNSLCRLFRSALAW